MKTKRLTPVEKPGHKKATIPANETSQPANETSQPASETPRLESETLEPQTEVISQQNDVIGQKPGAIGQQSGAQGMHIGASGLQDGTKGLHSRALRLKEAAMGQTQEAAALQEADIPVQIAAMAQQETATALLQDARTLHKGARPLTYAERRRRDVERFGKGNVAFLDQNDILMPFSDRITLVFTSEDTVKDYLLKKDLSDHYYERTIKLEAQRAIRYLNESYEKVIRHLNLGISRRAYFFLFKTVRSVLRRKRHDFVLPVKITNILLYGSLYYGFYYSDISDTFKYPQTSLKKIIRIMKELNWLHLYNSYSNRFFFITQEGRDFLKDTLANCQIVELPGKQSDNLTI